MRYHLYARRSNISTNVTRLNGASVSTVKSLFAGSSDEPWSSINGEKFLGPLSNHQLLNDSAPQRKLLLW